jgi:DNA-binding CsgD family transcriptional regulator
MSSERARSLARERIVRMCEGTSAPDALPWEVNEVLRRTIGYSRWCWIAGDPDSLLPTGGAGESYYQPEVAARLLVLEQAGDVNAKHVLARSRYPSAILSAATGGDLARSTRWDQCVRDYGVGDVLTAACRDAHGCWGWLEMLRDSDDPPFSSADAQLLDDVGSAVGSAMRRAAVRASPPTGDEPPGPGVVILDEQLRPASLTPAARIWIQATPPPTSLEDDGMVPLAMIALAGRAVAGRGGPELPARVRFRTPAGRWAVLDGAVLDGSDAGRVAITIRAASPEETVDLHSRAHGLTVRERQLVSLVLTGLSTRQLADELSISSYTVKDHLKAVFDKVGVRSRRELVAGILGHGADAAPAAA